MTDYTPIDADQLDQDSPVTTQLATALSDNPIAIAERSAGAPRVQIPELLAFATTGSGTWTIPDGVTAFEVTCTGGGGATNDGIASTFTYNSEVITGGAGSGHVYDPGNHSGGTATGGDINIPGGTGYSRKDEGSDGDRPGTSYWGGRNTYGGGYNGAGAGGTAIKRFVVVSGQTTASYTVGASGGSALLGGIVVIRY